MNKHHRRSQLGKMAGAELTGFTGRVQRIRKQEQRICQARFLRGQDARLPAAVRMTAQPELIGLLLAQEHKLFPQTLPVERGIWRARRSMRTLLAKRKIVARHFDRVSTEFRVQDNQQRGVAVRSSAVSEQ